MNAGDLLDQVDLAGDVAGAEGGHRHRPVRRHVEAEALEQIALLLGGDRDADQLVRALGPEADDRPLGQVALQSTWPTQRAPASSTISCVASVAAWPAR